MAHIFDIVDRFGKIVHLSNERWSHLRKKHPEILEYEWIKNAIEKPDKIVDGEYDSFTRYFYKFYKYARRPNRHLCVVIKYLNGNGFVSTAYFTKYIKN